MRISSFSVLALGFGLAGRLLSACSNSSDDCTALATCGNAAGTTSESGSAGKSGGAGGAGPEAGTSSGGVMSGGSVGMSGAAGSGGAGEGGQGGSGPKACTGDVADDAACWTSNEHGVFVSNEAGDDDHGDGTQEAPFATITKGIGAAAGKKVFVCLGASGDPYAEQVILAPPNDGVRLYGGFDCGDWSYSKTRSAEVASPYATALRIQSLKKGAYIENMSFTAADASGTDASSYGAFITDSKNVTLTRVKLTAGKGLDGVDGADGGPGADGTKVPVDDNAPQKGRGAVCSNPPSTQTGGTWGTAVSCGSSGGNGGAGRNDMSLAGGNGDPGLPASNVNPPGIDNAGIGSGTLGMDGNPGTPGSPGVPGTIGGKAADAGTFAPAGFVPAAGKDGLPGHVGQGGGGGGGSKGNGTCTGASGGAGGMGGCGGKPGVAGSGGGASVGLFTRGSEVSLVACLILSADGGSGGQGGAGGLRGQGAKGAAGGLGAALVADGGDGGKGGDGGDGGSGSGGTGGPSYALVFSGPKPTYDAADTMLTPGKGGDAGVGGTIDDVKAPDGSPGDAAEEFEVK